jgi:hypothetical protein
MIIGAIVHSIVMSEVIGILLSVDQSAADMKAQKDLVKSFTDHVKLDQGLSQELMTFFEYNRSRRHQIDRKQVRTLLTSSVLPRELMELLAGGLFEGELENNRFMTACLRYEKRLPVRFPLLLALALNERNFARKEMVYCAHDHPWNLFLVVKGSFAYIAFPSSQGGLNDLPNDLNGRDSGLDVARGSKKTLCTEATKASAREAAKNAANMHGALYPYQLFGPRAYFGDLEMLLRGARTRFSGARSEFDGGQTLVLHKTDLSSLIQDFARFGHAWSSKAKRREEHRRFLISRLKRGNNADVLAVETIQRYWRRKHSNNKEDGVLEDRIRSDVLKGIETRSEHFASQGHVSAMGKAANPHDLLQSLRSEMHSSLHTIRREIRHAMKSKHQGSQDSLDQDELSVPFMETGASEVAAMGRQWVTL